MGARIVDHYELQEELGHGGMATVYRATDRRLEREVALKLLHKHIADQPENRTRFTREARAAAKLKHPNILLIHDFSDPEDDVGYIATELIDGPTLYQMDRRDLQTYPEIAACLLWILSRALESAHDAGVIHRDIKPENIMIDRLGRPRLMDFGLARIRDAQRMTVTGTLMGSPAHMAPEIIEGSDYDGRVDIFALGTVLYFLTAGRLPFKADNPANLLRQILEGTYTPANQRNGRIVGGLSSIIDRMLAHDPDDRYLRAHALTSALGAFLEDLNIDDPERVFQRWWTEREAFYPPWRAALIKTITEHAEAAHAKGTTAIAEALDWTNRLLSLDPDNAVGHDLLLRISTRSSKAVWRKRIVMILIAMICAAIPLFIVRISLLSRHDATRAQPGFVTTSWNTSVQNAQRLAAARQGAAFAQHVHTRAQDLKDPPHVVAFNHAKVAASDRLYSARTQAGSDANRRAAAARRAAHKARTRKVEAATSADKSQDAAAPPQMYTVDITVQPPVCRVYVDGTQRCENGSQCTLQLPAGPHVFVARHPVTGVEVQRRVVIHDNGAHIRMRVPWKPATLQVQSNKPGLVLFDGRRVGHTGDNIPIRIEGLHSSVRGTMRVIPDGDFGTPIERQIELSSGETRRERIHF